MSYIGAWDIDDYLTFECNTHDPETGASADADSAPAYRIYEDETAGAILTGTLAVLDDANTTGFYSERIQLTAANGFELGKSYRIYIEATVGGITASKTDTFQIGLISNVTYWDGSAAPPIASEADIAEAVRDVDNSSPAAASLGEALNDLPVDIRDKVIEPAGSITFGQALSYILSACAGVTDDDGVTLKTSDGTLVRISATIVGSERTAISLTAPIY